MENKSRSTGTWGCRPEGVTGRARAGRTSCCVLHQWSSWPWGCSDSSPPAGGPRAAESCCSPTALGPEVPSQEVSRAVLLLKALGESLSLPLPASGGSSSRGRPLLVAESLGSGPLSSRDSPRSLWFRSFVCGRQSWWV